jgi:amidase
MESATLDWQAVAAAKVGSTLSKIPSKWRLHKNPIEGATEKRQLAGAVAKSFLNKEEVEIVRTSAESLVSQMSGCERSALSVVEAFCKAAAVAHQLVSMAA